MHVFTAILSIIVYLMLVCLLIVDIGIGYIAYVRQKNKIKKLEKEIESLAEKKINQMHQRPTFSVVFGNFKEEDNTRHTHKRNRRGTNPRDLKGRFLPFSV